MYHVDNYPKHPLQLNNDNKIFFLKIWPKL